MSEAIVPYAKKKLDDLRSVLVPARWPPVSPPRYPGVVPLATLAPTVPVLGMTKMADWDGHSFKACARCGFLCADNFLTEHSLCSLCAIDENSIISRFMEEFKDEARMLVALHAYNRTGGQPIVEVFNNHWLAGIPGIVKDEWHNWYVKVGESKTIFTSHTDTVGASVARSNLVLDGSGSFLSNRMGVLGSDDSAGVYVMLIMLKAQVPGLYVFHDSEERGCVGSRKFVDANAEMLAGYAKCISFDRRGYDSVISHQGGSRCCSHEFAVALSNAVNAASDGTMAYKPDDTGTVTDSKMYVGIVPECTNLSVGYTGAHGSSEKVSINHIMYLARYAAAIKWEELPVNRDPKKVEAYRSFSHLPGNMRSNPHPSFKDTWEPDYFGEPYEPKKRENTKPKMSLGWGDDGYWEKHGDVLAMLYQAKSEEELSAIVALEIDGMAALINDVLELGLENKEKMISPSQWLDPHRAEIEEAYDDMESVKRLVTPRLDGLDEGLYMG